MASNVVEIKNLKQFKTILNKLIENDAIEFKTTNGKKLTFYGVIMPGIVSDGVKQEVIKQSILFIEN